MATGPIETHLHRSFNWENGAPGPQEGPRGRSANCGNGLSAQSVRLRSEINLPEARAPLGRERGADSRARDPRCRIRPAGRAPRAAALPPSSSPAPPGHLGFRRSPVFASTPRAAIRPTTIPPAPGPLSGPIALPPTRRFQNHAGLRGRAGNPRACRNR